MKPLNIKYKNLMMFQGLIVDQTIEKVSFCAPDRNHDRGFSYICRDGTTRRWMCHGFLALKESVINFNVALNFFEKLIIVCVFYNRIGFIKYEVNVVN